MEGVNYRLEKGRLQKAQWHEVLKEFEDASLYQSWEFGAVNWGQERLEHVILRQGQTVLAAAQVLVMEIPLIRGGLAYVRWGPLWRRRGGQREPACLVRMIRALSEEYAGKRRLALRIVPNEVYDGDSSLASNYTDQGFRWNQRNPYRTILIDLRPSMEELKQGLRRSWRKTLRRAESEALEITEGTDEALVEIALQIQREMQSRKGYSELVDMRQFLAIHRELPEGSKLKTAVGYHGGEPVAALTWSIFGDTCLPVIGATRAKALELKASYRLFWLMIQRLKDRQVRWCDLAGINPERNPGSYLFKSGLAGRNGVEVRYLGQFDLCRNPFSSLLLGLMDWQRHLARQVRLGIEKLKAPRGIRADGAEPDPS